MPYCIFKLIPLKDFLKQYYFKSSIKNTSGWTLMCQYFFLFVTMALKQQDEKVENLNGWVKSEIRFTHLSEKQ